MPPPELRFEKGTSAGTEFVAEEKESHNKIWQSVLCGLQPEEQLQHCDGLFKSALSHSTHPSVSTHLFQCKQDELLNRGAWENGWSDQGLQERVDLEIAHVCSIKRECDGVTAPHFIAGLHCYGEPVVALEQ